MGENFKKLSKFQIFLIGTILIFVAMFSNHLWYGDVLFHTDVARDLLVLQDMVRTHQPTLIGPRSGGIPGLFHGPLWYYLSLIPFIVVGGSPVGMGWWWWLLDAGAVGGFFFASSLLTKNLTARLLGCLVFIFLVMPAAAGPTNNFLADLLGFVPFILWVRWWKKPTFKDAVLGWLTLGVLVQFQMAFAGPVALIWLPIFGGKVIKDKILGQATAFLGFFPPLFSFGLFDLRHDWLQVKSVLNYLQTTPPAMNFWLKLAERLQLFLLTGTNLFKLGWFNPVVMVIFGWLAKKNLKTDLKTVGSLVATWYLGWWGVALLFSGTIWSYYFSPFFGILILIVVVVAGRSKPARILLGILVCWVIFNSREALIYSPSRFNSSSWRLLSQIAADGLVQPDRGYFVYSQDQFAYPLKYAFSYYATRHPEARAVAFQKKGVTVLVKAADDPNNPFSTALDWQINKLHLNLEPVLTKTYPHGYKLEVFQLDQKNLQEPVDPNLIIDLHFR